MSDPQPALGESKRSAVPSPSKAGWIAATACLFAAVIGLSHLKFGNPVILDAMVARPGSLAEWIFSAWPVAWGYGVLAGALLICVPAIRFRRMGPSWLLAAPIVWLAWQGVAAAVSIDQGLTRMVLPQFAACVACFYVGVLILAQSPSGPRWWGVLLCSFVLVLWSAFGQHYGGLEATRQFVRSQPGWEQLSPEYLKRLASDRVFATLFYPNALAGLVLLLQPPLMVYCWSGLRQLPQTVRFTVVGLLGYAGIASLVWSGSKAGWLIGAMVLGVVVMRWKLPMRWRIYAVLGLGLATVAVLGIRHSAYFNRGATSAIARIEYWKVATIIVRSNPLLGTGPGTFAALHPKLKRPDAENAKLVHNDYLQQATDSGVPGALAYAAWLVGALLWTGRSCWQSGLRAATWLGLLGFAVHSCFEFGLYIPALAWSAFSLLGYLVGTEHKEFDTAIHQT